MVGVAFVHAQTDTTNTNGTMQSPGMQPMQYNKQDRVVIKPTDVPPSLRQTLKENKDYTGWDKSTIYQDKGTNTYYFDLPGTGAGTAKTYYFDKNGKSITGMGTAGTGPSYNSSGDPNKPPTSK